MQYDNAINQSYHFMAYVILKGNVSFLVTCKQLYPTKNSILHLMLGTDVKKNFEGFYLRLARIIIV